MTGRWDALFTDNRHPREAIVSGWCDPEDGTAEHPRCSGVIPSLNARYAPRRCECSCHGGNDDAASHH